MLKVNNINVYYGKIHALKDVSFEVHPGEIVALIGANGAGKSTTLKTVSGMLRSKTGSIEQYGIYASISDTLEMRAYDDVILGATEEMGASAAETQETLIRDALLVNDITLDYEGEALCN